MNFLLVNGERNLKPCRRLFGMSSKNGERRPTLGSYLVTAQVQHTDFAPFIKTFRHNWILVSPSTKEYKIKFKQTGGANLPDCLAPRVGLGGRGGKGVVECRGRRRWETVASSLNKERIAAVSAMCKTIFNPEKRYDETTFDLLPPTTYSDLR